MRKLIYSMTVSLDGYISGPQGEGDWAIPDEELHQFHNDQVRALGGHLLGRRLYEVMSYWETAEERNPTAPRYAHEFARIWKDLPKIRLLEHAHEGRGQDEALERGSGRGGPEAEGTARGAPCGGGRDPRCDLDATRFDRRVSPLRQPGRPWWRHALLHRVGAECRACTPRDANVRHRRRLPSLRASTTAPYIVERLQNSRQSGRMHTRSHHRRHN
jgi:RibD domain-containing protein